MTFWTYVLECADRSYYIGHTDNLEARLVAHQNGYYGGWTTKRLPVRLVFSETLRGAGGCLRVRTAIEGLVAGKKGGADRWGHGAAEAAGSFSEERRTGRFFRTWFDKLTMSGRLSPTFRFPHVPSVPGQRLPLMVSLSNQVRNSLQDVRQ